MGSIIAILLVIGLLLSVTLFANISSPRLLDTSMMATANLPSSTLAVTSNSFDTGLRGKNDMFPENVELLLQAPDLNTIQLPDGKVMQYSIISSDNADLSSPTIVHLNVLTQTGSGGIGALAAQARARMTTITQQYIGFTITPSASGTGDASGAQATLAPVF